MSALPLTLSKSFPLYPDAGRNAPMSHSLSHTTLKLLLELRGTCFALGWDSGWEGNPLMTLAGRSV
jgi:hypothetical protein